MLVIGLTGGIGSGKSTVAGFLKELGAEVIDADKVGHQLYEPHTEGWQGVVKEFGKELILPDNSIDRRKLGAIVFSDAQALARLNQLLHPIMYRIFEQEIKSHGSRGTRALVLDAAILLEAGWDRLADEVWVTIAPEGVAVQRIVARSGLKEEQVQARMRSQMPPQDKAKRAQVVIDTDCSLEEVRQKVLRLWNQRVMV